MAALVQTIPQQSGTVPVLQTRPASSSGAFTSPQSLQQQNSRNPAMSWNTYNTTSNSGSYRASHQVVAPYAFTSSPNLSNSTNMQQRQSWTPHLRPENRASSAPSAPQGSANSSHVGVNSRFVNTAAGSVSTSSSTSSLQSHMSKDDSAIPSRQHRSEPTLRPLSTANLPPPPSPTPAFMNISSPTVARPSPDRYRRGNRRADGTGAPQSPVTPGNEAETSSIAPAPGAPNPAQDVLRNIGHNRAPSADDISRPEKPQPELAKRYRRRSWGGNIDNTGLINLQLHLPSSSPIPSVGGGQDYFDEKRPRSAQSHREVSGSIHSARSSSSSVRDGHAESVSGKTVAKPDDFKRPAKPSPLSQPPVADSTPEPKASQSNQREKPQPESLASQRLAEITKNDSNRLGKSRLRRAFSFGSASELLKTPQSNGHRKEGVVIEKARREMLQEELGPEQAAIAEQQEASGLGESIYSHHQGRFFNSSTDNISVSSTASSASIMLRKMGKGMKRSTRSLVGLFRPKSVISTSPAEGTTVQPMAPQVSVINVEAERKSVTMNADTLELPQSSTALAKVDSNAPLTISHEDDLVEVSQSRKSIVGGDKERAEVLAAVRKGILKKNNSESATQMKQTAVSQLETSTDSPHSSAPSTPEDKPRSANQRSDSVNIADEDSFLPEGQFTETDAKSAALTPQPIVPKSLVFSPRIQFHETWPSGEYDRRGDIATCNRLTPLLAQQIKEELNNFKMEMEVHETSKIYTHFL